MPISLTVTHGWEKVVSHKRKQNNPPLEAISWGFNIRHYSVTLQLRFGLLIKPVSADMQDKLRHNWLEICDPNVPSSKLNPIGLDNYFRTGVFFGSIQILVMDVSDEVRQECTPINEVAALQ